MCSSAGKSYKKMFKIFSSIYDQRYEETLEFYMKSDRNEVEQIIDSKKSNMLSQLILKVLRSSNITQRAEKHKEKKISNIRS